MTSMARNVMRSIPITEDAHDSPVTIFRDRIATRNEEHAKAFPRAAALEAQVLYRLHEEINGEAVNLRGVRSAQGFRLALQGEKNFTLSDLCRLATSPTREARTAVKAAVQEIAARLGYELVATDAKAMEAHEALAGVAQSAGNLTANIAMALANDGRIDEHEARGLESDLDEAQKTIDRVRATVRTARAQEK